MSEAKGDLYAAAKQLADSEIELLKNIEKSRKEHKKNKMSTANNVKRTSARVMNAKASQVILAAKQKAMQRKKEEKKVPDVIIADVYHKSMTAVQESRNKDTGLVFDKSMSEHRCLWDENYPECPDRFNRVLQRCEELGLVERCRLIEARLATKEELLLKHDNGQIEKLRETQDCHDLDKLEQLASKYDSVYFHPSTYKLSLLATGSTINLVENVCKGETKNGMAIVRPPGHHAMESEYCGYCFFNNVAIAVEKVLQSGLATKVLIVDWDVHHGQATQQMFYNDPRVVYFSIHRYEHGEFWPNLRESDFDFVGEGSGEGYNFNVPLNKTGMQNSDYLAIFQQVLLPMAYEFQPDLIVVSAGYDAAIGCPEFAPDLVVVSAGFDAAIGDEKGEMEVSPACYSHLISSLMSLASGKVCVVLEGGYYVKTLAEGAALTLRTLLGDPCPMLQTLEPPSDSVRDTILNVIYAHKPYWNCYQYQDLYSINSVPSPDEKLIRHLPVVEYRGEVEVPAVYETRNCYPVVSDEKRAELEKRINSLIHMTSLNKAPKRLGIVYDTVMTKHRDFSDEGHPERPERITGIWAKCNEAEVLKRGFILKSRPATDEELLLVHSQDYLDIIKKTVNLEKKSELEKLAKNYNSIYLNNATESCARLSAGSLLQVVDSVLNGEVQCGVAIIRPPGHHAEHDAACGFCIFNNVAMAAKYAVKMHGLKRVLIVDWDIHHGNGIQSIVEDDPSILYISVHRYDRGSFFPNSKDANYDKVGTGRGEGFIVNVPWNKKGMGDPEYVAAFQQVVLPIAYQFNPELVLVSAGFDACVGDPLGGCKVSPEMYGHLTHWLSSLANGRIILSLEGGYNVTSISYAMAMCAKTLLGDPLPMLDPTPMPNLSAIFSINNTLKTHRQYWPNLKFQLFLPKEQDILLRNNLAGLKIASKVENETVDLNLLIDKSKVANEEISKLQSELKNMKMCSENGIRKCADDNQNKSNQGSSKSFDCQPGSSAGTSSSNVTPGTLSDYLSDNLNALLNEEMFAVIPLKDCPHVETVKDVPDTGIDVNAPCHECASSVENWICLDCYTVHCARSVNQHGLTHNQETQHPMALSFCDLSVWCYECEAYIDHPKLYNARNIAHRAKFGQEMPWTYEERLLEVTQGQ